MYKANQLDEAFNILENIQYEDMGIEPFTEFHDNELNSSYIAYHHNNCKIHGKEMMINNSKINLEELNELSKDYNANIVIENADVISNQNMLFDKESLLRFAEKVIMMY
ncbi:hypothetical protein [Terrisporobacter petrolearius]|uniref:hypothetical protein n=1 Tax=Terrisporobacter petrolearius TaxID=1460447 RepID=UPI001D169468|nr:hypothetical protein [Terrisporobacter petrolearius]